MSTTDLIALAAVGISAIALVASFLTQMASAQIQARFQSQLELMKQEFARGRDELQLLAPIRLSEMNVIDQWIREGYSIGRQIEAIGREQTFDTLKRFEDLRPSLQKLNEWMVRHADCYALAIRIDPSQQIDIAKLVGDEMEFKSDIIENKSKSVHTVNDVLELMFRVVYSSYLIAQIGAPSLSENSVEVAFRYSSRAIDRLRESLFRPG